MTETQTANMDIIRRAIAAGDQRDEALLAQFTAPDLVVHAQYDSFDPLKGEQLGYDFQRSADDNAAMSAYDLEQFPETHTTIDEMFAVGDDKVLTITTNVSTHKSGKKVSVKGMYLERLVDGKVVEGWYSWDRLGYWQQLGVAPHVRDLATKLDAQ